MRKFEQLASEPIEMPAPDRTADVLADEYFLWSLEYLPGQGAEPH